MPVRSMLRLAVLGLVLMSHHAVRAQDDEDFGGGDDDYDPDAYGGGEDEEPPPPAGGEPRELLSVADFEEYLAETPLDPSVVAAFTAKEVLDPAATMPEGWDVEEDGDWQAPMIENPALTSLNSIASTVHGYRYAYTTAAEVLTLLKTKKSGLYVFRAQALVSKEHGDRPRERFPSDKWSEDGVSNWLQAKSQPLVGHYSAATRSRSAHAVDDMPTLIIFLNLDMEGNAKGVNYVLKRARKAAVALKGKMRIAVATNDNIELADFGLKLKSVKSDLHMAISAGDDRYGAPEGTAFSAAALDAFASQYLKGELTPYVKPDEPDPPPAGDDEYDDSAEDGEMDEEEMKDEP